MAGQICKSLINKNVLKILTKQIYNTSITVDRHIYGNCFLSIDDYLESRHLEDQTYRILKGKFLERISQSCKEDSSSLIFTGDLKRMVHLVDNNEAELNLMISMLKKYGNQNSDLCFNDFRFGPVIMRCLHHFGDADRAYSLLTDKSLDSLFNQVYCYIIAMDILWKKEQYEKVFEVFEILKKRQINGTEYSKYAVVLYLAACYKQNTAESLNRARILIKNAAKYNMVIARKSALFAASLALNQNAPELALEFLALVEKAEFFPLKNLKIIALAKLDRIEECLEILRTCLDGDPAQRLLFPQVEICEETLKILRSEIDRLGNSENDLATLDRLEKSLIEKNLLSKDSIDACICRPIFGKKRDLSGYRPQHYGRPRQSFRSGFTNSK